MASDNFNQKRFELERTTQHVIERILEINHEIAGLYAPMESAFSSFSVLRNFITYEASIRVAIQDFALAHFELVFPTHIMAEVEAPRETEPPYPSWFGVPPISLLFNVSITQISLKPEKAPLGKEEPRLKALQASKPPESLQKIKAEPAREPEATLFSHVAMLQTKLAATVTSRLETASLAIFESQKQLLKLGYPAPSSDSVLRKAGVEEIPTEKVPTSQELPQVRTVQTTKPKRPTSLTERLVKRGVIEAEIEEAPQKALLSWAATIHRELLKRVAPTLKIESMLLQSRKQALRVVSTVSESRVAPLEKTELDQVPASQVATPRLAHEIKAAEIARPSLLKRPSEQKVKRRIVEEQLEETSKETLLQWIISIQKQLMTRLSPPLEIESKVLLKSQKKMISEPSVALGAKNALPERTLGEDGQAPHILVPEEKTAKGTVEFKAAPELPWLIAYVNTLPTLMLEAQRPFATALHPPEAAINHGEPQVDVTTESKLSLSQPVVPHPVLKEVTPPASWVEQVVLPMLDSLRTLYTFPVATLTTQRIQAETVTEKITAFEMPLKTGVEDAVARRSPASSNLITEERHIEAIRLPAILAQLLGDYLRKSPMTLPEQSPSSAFLEEELSLGKIGERQFGAEPVVAKQSVGRVFSFSQKVSEERPEQGPAAFVEELQQVRAVYGRELSELAVSGPVRATKLSELASGVSFPSLPESELPEEPIIPEIIETTFPKEPPASERLRRAFPEEESINVNVFEGTAEEDLRELERKIGRILVEQLSDSGKIGSLGTTVLRESSFELAGKSAAELGALDSQAISSALLRRSNAGEGGINLNMFTETADMRDLERKLRRILSAQISRYYGSSNP
jgi:hypothetical protein